MGNKIALEGGANIITQTVKPQHFPSVSFRYKNGSGDDSPNIFFKYMYRYRIKYWMLNGLPKPSVGARMRGAIVTKKSS